MTRHEAIETPLPLASGIHGDAIKVAKLREIPLRLRGFVRSLWRWAASNNFTHAIPDRRLVGVTHPGKLLEEVRRVSCVLVSGLRIDRSMRHVAGSSEAGWRRRQGNL